MKKPLLTLSLLLLAGVFAVSAQTWTTFNHDKEEFSVDFPSPNFNGEYSTIWSNATSEYSQVYEGTYFLIFSYSKVKDSPYHYVKELAKTNNAAKQEFRIGEYQGERYDFKDDEGFYQSIVTFQGKKHFHIFHVAARKKDDPNAARFFRSLKIKNAKTDTERPVVKEPAETNKEAVSLSPDTDGAKAGTGGEIGGGIGDGSGVVYGGGPGPSMGGGPAPRIGGGGSSQSTGPNAAVRILTKPRPSYTEIARRYGLSGTVRLRVTFLSDGKIGAITPINWLPFGLTNSAITAARQVKFTPAVKNNVPVTVSKMIEYNFILY